MRRVFLALSVFACLSCIEAQNWQEVCRTAKAQPLVPVEPAGPLAASQLPDCDETALYYGLGANPDYAAALQCGWYQRAHPRPQVGNMFYGPGVLTMLYANGRGVPRDYTLAIRFACENPWAATAEFEARVGHLDRLRDTHSETATFDLCDDITSGLSGGACTSVKTRTRDTARDARIADIVNGFSAAAKAAFPPLQKAEAAFEQARIEGEVDLSGTLRGAFQLEEEARLRDQFLINLERFGSGDIPAASAADLATLDLQLNAVYRRLQNSPASQWQYGTVTPQGIRNTERKWLALADAWTAFSRTAWPRLSAARVRAQIIRLRLHQLRSLDASRP